MNTDQDKALMRDTLGPEVMDHDRLWAEELVKKIRLADKDDLGRFVDELSSLPDPQGAPEKAREILDALNAQVAKGSKLLMGDIFTAAARDPDGSLRPAADRVYTFVVRSS